MIQNGMIFSKKLGFQKTIKYIHFGINFRWRMNFYTLLMNTYTRTFEKLCGKVVFKVSLAAKLNLCIDFATTHFTYTFEAPS